MKAQQQMSNDGILKNSNLESMKFKQMKTKFKVICFKVLFYPRHDTQPTLKEDKCAFISYLHSRKPNGI